MTCQGIDRDEQVERYLRNELDSVAQSEFETHILECSACLQRLEVMQAISHDLQDRAAEVRLTQDTRMPWWKWLTAATAVLVVGAAVGTLTSKHAPPKQIANANPPSTGTVTQTKTPQDAIAVKEATQSNAASDSQPGVNQTLATLPPGKHSVAAGSGDQPQKGVPVDSHSASASGGSRIANQATQRAEQSPGQVVTPDGGTAQALPGAITAGVGSQLPLAPGEGAKNGSDEVAKELFRLGTVKAPPYTFSGLAASTKVDGKQSAKREEGLGAAMPTGQPENTQPPAPGRTYFQNAMGAYVEKRYGDAIPLLEADLELEPKALDANYYLGICRLLLANPADAIAPLKTVAASNTSALASPAHFYLAKAYIQVEDLDNAEVELRAAGGGSGRLAAEARAILHKLQTLKTKP